MVADKSTVVRSRGVEQGVWQGNGRLNFARAVAVGSGDLRHPARRGYTILPPGRFSSGIGAVQITSGNS